MVPSFKPFGRLVFTLFTASLTGLAILTDSTSLTEAGVEDWPQFRGPNCSGVSDSRQPLPDQFSKTEHVGWTAPLGDGIGSPIAVDGRVFVSAMDGESRIGLHAFDLETGAPLWHRTWDTGPLPEIHKMNSHASTTPAADGERVYFYFGSLGLIAVDARTGSDVWRQKLPKPFFVFKWGAGMSPVLSPNAVLFCQDDDLNPALYALDRATGKILWKDDRSDMSVNYSHPVVCRTKGRDEIVVAGTGLLIGYDPVDGRRLWHARSLLRNIKTTPVCVGDTLYISLQSSGIANQWLATADRGETGNNDGALTRAEIRAFSAPTPVPESFLDRVFDRGDTDGNNILRGEELDRAFLSADNFAGARFNSRAPADEFILAVRGGGGGDVSASHVLWKHATKYTDHIVSPLVTDGRMLLVKSGGIATCFDVRDGSPLWGPARIQNTSDYFASPVCGDGKIYVAGANGVVVVLKQGTELDVLARNDLGEPILATPAISNGRLLVRTRSQLFSLVP